MDGIGHTALLKVKNAQKSFAFRSKIFYREDFWLIKAQNGANP